MMEQGRALVRLQNYGVLRRLLGCFIGYHDGAEMSDRTETEAANEYVSLFSEEEKKNIVKEAAELLAEPVFPFREVSNAAYRYFKDETEARRWVEWLAEIVKQNQPAGDPTR